MTSLVACVASVLLVGCTSGDVAIRKSDAGTCLRVGDVVATGPGVEPPPPNPSAPSNGVGKETVLALHKLYLGAKDWSGHDDVGFWKSVGYDVDGLISDADSANHCCILPGGSTKLVKTDGNGGIDNSFRRKFAPDPLVTCCQPRGRKRRGDRRRALHLVVPIHEPWARAESEPRASCTLRRRRPRGLGEMGWERRLARDIRVGDGRRCEYSTRLDCRYLRRRRHMGVRSHAD